LVDEVVAVGCAAPILPGGELASFNCAFIRNELSKGQDRNWLRKEIGPRLKDMLSRLTDRARFGIPM
jgi:hypothetical protein